MQNLNLSVYTKFSKDPIILLTLMNILNLVRKNENISKVVEVVRSRGLIGI